ncbi:hypothetical protein HYU08_01150 [Candidatus Woesearchaeota archaeon]|nr:hypothetical protein [Candidatus Woesearchaeota archaeon]
MKDETPDIDADENDIVPYREGQLIDFYSKWYKKFYDDYHYLDFSDYDYFNFMVQFVGEELNLPAGINLKIYGPENELYFDGEVLGYVQNGLLFSKDSFMHIKVPIGDYKAVKSFEIGTSTSLGAEVNTIQVKDIYLSKEGVNPLCSGQDSVKEGSSSWLEDADFGDPDAEINGAALCTNLYGPNAWLGSDEELDDTTANCCGNAANEYYSGRSVEVAATTELAGEQSEFNRYGCWNSQPIASGKTIMNVGFDVSSTEEKKTFEYTPLVLDALKLNFRRLATSEAEKKFVAEEDLVPEDYISQSADCTTKPVTLDSEHTFVVLCNFTLRDQFSVHRQMELWFKDISTDKIEIDFYDMITNEYLDTDLVKTEKKDLFGNTYLEGPAIYLGEDETERVWNRPIAIVASLKPDTYFPSKPIPLSKPNTDKKTYSCKEHECLFPLPGNPPYDIVNTHPDLYELYFVTGSLEEDLITPTNKHFEVYGNVKARKIAKQVLFYNEGDEEDSGFYGCNAASFLQSHLTQKNSCSVINGMFCSPSRTVQPTDDPKDRYTVINSWSDEEIKFVGYNTDDLPDPTEDQNISEYYQQLNLQLESKTIPFPANKRNHTASVLPARNFLANAEFMTIGAANQVPYWDVIKSDGFFAKDEESYTQESTPQGNKILLGNNEKLRSERIAIPQNVNLHLSQAQECAAKVFLVDNDGNSEAAELPQFPTGDASYVIVEFSGACEVEKPMLQLVDELGPAEYAYQTQEILQNFDARSGLACCPDNYCWNGYTCVKPMAGLSTIAEHVADGRDYRCVDGQWKQAAFKFDWNQQRWGFCPEQNECFVLPQPHGSLDNTAENFYEGQGNYPLCIKDSEYIFDNYCNQGNWTSRTKYVATKLLEVAENSEFVLYCSPYKETLLDYENVENYLAGDLPQAQQPKPGLPGTLQPKKPLPPLDTCYPLDAKGKGLIPDEQNTCINNVCVLKYKDGGEFKAAFATTLNKALEDPDSFLLSLGVPQPELQGLCQEDPNGEFVECDLSNVDVPGDLYYSSKLNAVIYAKEGLSLEPSVVDKIINFFQKLFGGSSADPEKEFIADVQTFREVYLLDKDDQKVRAVKEVFPDVKETLIAEYENFETPVCDYVKNIKAPPELELEALEEASGVFKIHCAINESVQRVVLDAGSDFFWPQLTGKLRVNE